MCFFDSLDILENNLKKLVKLSSIFNLWYKNIFIYVILFLVSYKKKITIINFLMKLFQLMM